VGTENLEFVNTLGLHI